METHRAEPGRAGAGAGLVERSSVESARPILPAVWGYNDNVPITSEYLANCSAQIVTRKDDKCVAAM